jgi:hypothetical protein
MEDVTRLHLSSRTTRQLVNVNPTSMHGVYLRLVVSNGAGL